MYTVGGAFETLQIFGLPYVQMYTFRNGFFSYVGQENSLQGSHPESCDNEKRIDIPIINPSSTPVKFTTHVHHEELRNNFE